MWKAEHAVFGSDHSLIGGYLLGLWGLNDDVVEALAYHHRPSECVHQEFNTLTLVHIVNALDQDTGNEEIESSSVDVDYLAKLDLLDKLDSWRMRFADVIGHD